MNPEQAIHADTRLELVQRIAASPEFRRSPALRAFLLYITTRALEGAAEITEAEIGCHALHRRDDFDPKEDNIVRVQARHLRKRLDEYFTTAGAAEPLVLRIPKGSYLPQFLPRDAEPEAPTPRPIPRLTLILAVSLAAVSLLCVVLGTRTLPHAATGTAPWTALFVEGANTNIVVGDAGLGFMQDSVASHVTLQEYLNPRFLENLVERTPSPELRANLRMLAARQYTSLADLSIASRLLQLSTAYRANAVTRYGRHLNVRDFKSGNFILIGSRRALPWVELFDPQLRFSTDYDPVKHWARILDRQPVAGGPPFYETKRDGATVLESYSTLALMPNLENSGNVLLLAGLTMEATEAAGEFTLSPDFARRVEAAAGNGFLKDSPAFEILLRTNCVAGAAKTSDIVAVRRLSVSASHPPALPRR